VFPGHCAIKIRLLEITRAARSTAIIAAVLNVHFGSFAAKQFSGNIDQCPLCPDSDHSMHEPELPLSANSGQPQLFDRIAGGRIDQA
jgi:hypothetical protein